MCPTQHGLQSTDRTTNKAQTQWTTQHNQNKSFVYKHQPANRLMACAGHSKSRPRLVPLSPLHFYIYKSARNIARHEHTLSCSSCTATWPMNASSSSSASACMESSSSLPVPGAVAFPAGCCASAARTASSSSASSCCRRVFSACNASCKRAARFVLSLFRVCRKP